MIRAKGFTIWIKPTGEILERLLRIVQQMSKKFGTAEFTPHVTIVGDIEKPLDEVSSKTMKLASLLKPFQIELTGKIVCEENDWTRTMIVLAKQTPELMQAYQKAVEVFGIKDRGFYRPHLSLMYSEDIPKSVRSAVAQALEAQQLTATLNVTDLSLINTAGGISDWKKIMDLNLKR